GTERQHNYYMDVMVGHELVHVWSYQHQGTAYGLEAMLGQWSTVGSGEHRNTFYGYELGAPSIWNYNEEQRASIIEGYWRAERLISAGRDGVFIGVGGAEVDAQTF